MSRLSVVWRARSAIVLVGALASGLALVGGPSGDAKAEEVASFGVPLSPNAHIYSYFIINGMARGAYMTGKIKPKDMPALIQMDETTRKIILHNLDSQTIRSDFKADQALAHYLAMIPG